MKITIIAGPTYGLNHNTKEGDANRYVVAVRIVAQEEGPQHIIVTDAKTYQADVFGAGATIAAARSALEDAIQAAVDTNEPGRAVQSLAAKMARDKARGSGSERDSCLPVDAPRHGPGCNCVVCTEMKRVTPPGEMRSTCDPHGADRESLYPEKETS